MDCHVFRRLCDELAPALMGCRIEKIHRPAKDVTLFTLYGTGGKRFLFLRAGRKAPFLFLSTHKIPVGSAPPADIMRLRKYLADRRIIDVLPDWVGRRLYLHVNADTECWLTLDLREGPSLLFDTPPEPEIPAWPDPAHWAEACEGDGWRNWPVITPPLRRTLPLLPPDEQAALLLDLEAGGGDLFLYENAAGERELSAWPLPPERRRDADGTPREELVVEDAIRACAAAGEAQVLRGIAALSRAEAAKPHQAEANRLRKLLLKLESEKTPQRHGCGTGCRPPAQSQLYRFAEEKHASVTLDGPEGLSILPSIPASPSVKTWRRCSTRPAGASEAFPCLKAALPPYRPIWPVRSKPGSWHKPRRPRRRPPTHPLPPRRSSALRNCPRTYSRSAAATASCSFGAATPRGTPSFSSWQPRTISGCIPAVGRARTS
ncbi:MAG: NFACT family protein [Bilophila wadsworthia]